MLKKMITLFFFVMLGAVSISGNPTSASAQDSLAEFKNNSCVNCHSRSNESLIDSSRYFEWHISPHKLQGVGCDKCHGGNPGTGDKGRAHFGMLPAKDEGSKVNKKNLPETCGACHQAIAKAFTSSKHYQQLKSAGLGPSCNTCHAHMASEVIYTAEEISTVCSSCHDSATGLQPKRPEIAQNASEAMLALRRANGVIVWADGLLKDAQNKKMDVTAEQPKLQAVHEALMDAKASWHAFELGVVRKKSDAAFDMGTKIKDALRNKLYPQK